MTKEIPDTKIKSEKPDDTPLRGVEKAAVLFLCLQEERGSELMQRLDEREIHEITKAMATIGTIPASAVENVIREFSDQISGGAGVIGSFDVAQRLLSGFLPENKVSAIMSEIRHPDNGRSIWESFSALNEQIISTYLQGEHDQTIAAVLSKVKPDVSARVLPLFGEKRMAEIANRMIGLDGLPRHVQEELESAIENDFLTAATKKTRPDPDQFMADMFNRMDGDIFEKLSVDLEARSPQALASIKEKMFTFDNLVKLDTQSLQRLMRNCDNAILSLALRGAKKPVRDAFVGSLTARAKDTLEEEMKAMAKVRLRDVRKAQATIIDIANDLSQQNIILIPREGDEMI
jgi:flagellar motor switch protein FliG